MSNEYAFPHDIRDHGFAPEISNGMTLRDYFAAKAMQAILSSEVLMEFSDMVVESGVARGEWLSERAYKFADAMLEARKK